MSEKTNMVESPPHYTGRSVQCIEFTRHMDFTLGNAFKYAWRLGEKDDIEQERGKINWYLRDAITHQPAVLHKKLADVMIRRLTVMRAEFLDDEIWNLLIALVSASSGDYALLMSYVESAKVLSPVAHQLMFDDVA